MKTLAPNWARGLEYTSEISHNRLSVSEVAHGALRDSTGDAVRIDRIPLAEIV